MKSAITQETSSHPKSRRGSLSWPTKDRVAFEGEKGWVLGRAGQDAPPRSNLPRLFDRQFIDSRIACAVIGQRREALRILGRDLASVATMVYLDLPRLYMYKVEDESARFSTWLSIVRAHVDAAKAVLKPEGVIALHIDDAGAALARALCDDIFGSDHLKRTILWQKKYSAQQDLKSRIDDAQDYLFVYSMRPTKLETSDTWWDYGFAGKTEDATRDVERLRDDGVVKLKEIPKTSKPRELIGRLLEAFTNPGDVVVEVFSDTGFASTAAIEKDRVPILLAGQTNEELDYFEKCSRPRMEAALKASSGDRTKLQVLKVGSAMTAVKSDRRESTGRIVLPFETAAAAGVATDCLLPRPLDISSNEKIELPGFPSMNVLGELLPSLESLGLTLRQEVAMAGVNLRRDDPHHDFADPGRLDALVSAIVPLVAARGVLAVAVDEVDFASVRLLLERRLGGEQHAGTIAVEVPCEGVRSGHFYIVVFRIIGETTKARVGIEKEREYTNPDGDPRREWRDTGHKGARGGGPTTARPYPVPPYRWSVVRGKLPPGAWRLNEVTGVIWSPGLKKPGEFSFTVRVVDSKGAASERELTIKVTKDAPFDPPTSVWFFGEIDSAGRLRNKVKASSGAPQIIGKPPTGVVGQAYSVALEAQGGKPFDSLLLPGKETEGGKRTRYWEFGLEKITNAVLEDRAMFGRDGQGNPSFKVYRQQETASTQVELSWWNQARLDGSTPAQRLLDIFTRPDNLVLAVGDGFGLAVAASEGDRRVVVVGPNPVSSKARRFAAVLGNPIGSRIEGAAIRLNYKASDFARRLLWLEGYFPGDKVAAVAGRPLKGIQRPYGVRPNGEEVAVVLSFDEWPNLTTCSAIIEPLRADFKQVVIYHFRGNGPRDIPQVMFRRVPFELSCVS